MKISINGILSIIAHEAVVLTTYDDGVGYLTIGVGHTAFAGNPRPKKGMKISLIEAINIFREDMKKYEKRVNDFVTVPLSQHRFDALVSFDFNTGAIDKSTLGKLINQGNFTAAAKEFRRWNKAKGKVLKGLTKRRKDEYDVFTSGSYHNSDILVYDTKHGSPRKVSKKQILDTFGAIPEDEEEKETEELLANPKSSLLPMYRPRIKEQVVRGTLQKFSHLTPVDRQKNPVKVLGIRGYYEDSMGKKDRNDINLYDDAIIIVEPKGIHRFNANVDPSRQRNRIATLKSGQAVRYVPGPHGFSRKNGPYPAFRQDSDATVARFGSGDDTGIFWINIHRGGNTSTSSAGCQTIPPHQWNEFKSLTDSLLKKYSQSTFYYTLVEESDLVPEKKKPNTKNTKVRDMTIGGGAGAVVVTVVMLWEKVSNFIGSLL